MHLHTVVVFTKNNARILNGIEEGALGQFEGWNNAIVDPDLALVQGVPPHFWKLEGSLVLPMNEDEKYNRLKHIDRNGIKNEVVKVTPYVKKKLIKDEYVHYIAYFIIIALLLVLMGRAEKWF